MRALLSIVLTAWAASASAQAPSAPADLLRSEGQAGKRGGRLVFALHSEPKTLNPLTAVDTPSREVLGLLTADLIHIDRDTQRTRPRPREVVDGLSRRPSLRAGAAARPALLGRPALRRRRRGLQLPVLSRRAQRRHPARPAHRGGQAHRGAEARPPSDRSGPRAALRRPRAALRQHRHPPAAPPREGAARGQAVRGLDALHSARGDGGARTLPRQVLRGRRSRGPGAQPALLEGGRGRAGAALRGRDRLLLAPSEDARVLRFKSGETDVITRLSAANFGVLSAEAQAAARYRLQDLGAGLEYTFLFFNQNDLAPGTLPEVARKQAWFRQRAFRQAVSAALDRQGMVRLVYQGRGTALGTHVTPGNKLWVNGTLPRPQRSLARARTLLREAGFTWKAGRLHDTGGAPVGSRS